MLSGLAADSNRWKEQLVFGEYTLSLRASAQDFRGNPPVERNQVTITTKIATLSYSVGQSSNILPLTGGLPRQCEHWLAMTAYLYKHQFVSWLT